MVLPSVGYPDTMTSGSIEHRHLRSAIEFAVEVARLGQKNRPALNFPVELKPMFRLQRIPSAALGKLRRAIEAAPEFRSALGQAATPELVDEIGCLWLAQPEGWEQTARELAQTADQRVAEREEANELRREQRRREAAEQVAVRARSEVAAALARVSELESELSELSIRYGETQSDLDRIRKEIHEARTEARHERDRSAAARAEASRAIAALEAEREQRNEMELVQNQAEASRNQQSVEIQGLRDALEMARALVGHLAELTPEPASTLAGEMARTVGAVRVPLAVPGGVRGDSDLATDHLLRSGALVVVDGYNVAKLVWPNHALIEQRTRLIDAVETAAQRSGAEILIVFDGANVIGAHASKRRMIRIIYSAEGSIADDLIRSEVRRTPVDRSVVVITNDAEIIRDVRAMGANTLTSEAFATWCRN
jgi:predicted RNA-binding protein with PIN domain